MGGTPMSLVWPGAPGIIGQDDNWTPYRLLTNDDNAKWWDGRRTDLMTFNSGNVASWTDIKSGIAATQGTAINQPGYSSSEAVVQAAAADVRLSIPVIANADNHKWFCFVGKIVFSAAPSSDGSIFACNGTPTSTGTRIPYLGYTKATTTFDVQWRDSAGNNTISITATPAPHVVVSRLDAGVHRASMDGASESSTGSGITLPTPAALTGLIGDFRTGNATWKIRHIIIGNNALSATDVANLAKWGLRESAHIT